jgi:hypothetical protein
VSLQYREPSIFEYAGKLYVDGGPSTRGWHFHETMLRCPQLFAYLHVLKLVFPTTVPLARGILIHTGLAHYYARLKAVQQGEDPDRYHDPVTAMRICAHLEDEKLGMTRDDGQPYRRGVLLADELPVVIEALTAYMAHYATEQVEVLAVETELLTLVPPSIREEAEKLRDPECPVGQRVGNHPLGAECEGYHCTCPGAYLYSQRPDLMARMDGVLYIVDHKSRGRNDNRQTQGYCMSGQFQGYGIFGEQLWGKRFGGRMINYVTWGSDTKDGRKQPQFERLIPEKRPWMQRSFPKTIRHSERLIEMLKDEDPWDYPKTMIENGGCQHRYGSCPAVNLCSFGPAALGTLDFKED